MSFRPMRRLRRSPESGQGNQSVWMAGFGTYPTHSIATVNVRLRRNRTFVGPRSPSLLRQSLRTVRNVFYEECGSEKPTIWTAQQCVNFAPLPADRLSLASCFRDRAVRRGDRMATAKLHGGDLFLDRFRRTKNVPAISVLHFESIALALLRTRLNT